MTYFNSLHFGNIDSFCSGINLETDRPTVDLSSVSFIEPYALIYLGLFLRLYNSKGKFFNLILPKDSRVREYLSRMNFYQRFNFGKYPIGKENLWRFNTNTSMNDIVDIEKDNSAPEYVVSCLEDLLSKQYHINQVRFDIGSICEIVAEIIDNFVQHSGELLAVMTFQYYPKNQVLVVAIGDCGIGIKKSLSAHPNYYYITEWSDEDAIKKAFEPRVSCRGEGGMGLSQIKEKILEKNAILHFTSNKGCYIIKNCIEYKAPRKFELTGVQAEFIFKAES